MKILPEMFLQTSKWPLNLGFWSAIPEVRHSGGPLGLTLTLTLTPRMADLRNGGPPEWGAGT